MNPPLPVPCDSDLAPLLGSLGELIRQARQKALTLGFGKGFDERNLRHMRGFYQGFPIWNAVRIELSWTHYRTPLRVE